jgi:ABC-type sugar transport system substrate-binding protein
MGAGNAVKDAGKADSVLVYSTGGGDDVACKAVEDGIQDRIWSYDADGQGRDAGTMIDLLLQGAVAADGSMLSVESPMKIIKGGADYDASLCWKM